jgi:hypothetical protein
MAKITGNFAWNKPEVYTSFVQGKDAKAVYNSLEGAMANEMSYDEASKTLIGSNLFASARIDTLVKPLGMRVANLRDLSRPEVMSIVKDMYYTDAPALVFRSMDGSYEANLPLIKQLAEQIEQANGKLQLPVLVTGFDVKVIKDKTGYGLALVPRDDFKAVPDKRLSEQYNGSRFSAVDEQGLPLFDDNGSRTWYVRSNGLSRLYLNWNLNVCSYDENLANSNSSGLVVVVSAEGTAKNLEGRVK